MHVESSDGALYSEGGADALGRMLDPFPLRRYQQCVTAYTSRNMQHDTDALRAFTGIQKALAWSMNQCRFWNGLPASAFDWAILWTGARDLSLNRREGFPSHSWLGWKGHIVPAQGHYGEFDYKWLVSRTWIKWYVIDEQGKCVLVWDPVRDRTTRTDAQLQHTDNRIGVHSLTDVQTEDAQENESSKGADDDVEVSQDDDSTVEDVEEIDDIENTEPCPQYGWPREDDPYGRIPAKSLDTFIPSLQRSTTDRKPDNIKPGTLRFQTYVATYTLSQANPRPTPESPDATQKHQDRCFTLTDNQKRVCGIIWDHDTIPASKRNAIQSQGCNFDILILSYAAPGTKLPFRALKIGLPEPYKAVKQDEGSDGQVWIQDEWHEWDMLNVMLAIPAQSNGSELLGATRATSI